MLTEFEIDWHVPDAPLELRKWTVKAIDAGRARERFDELFGDGAVCRLITPILPVIDWQAETFGLDEASVYLNCSISLVERFMTNGTLPKARGGRPLFTRRMLDKVIEARMSGGPEDSVPRNPGINRGHNGRFAEAR